jgi:hypothetical protein
MAKAVQTSPLLVSLNHVLVTPLALPAHTCILTSPEGVETTQTLEGIQAQILQNNKDFAAAVKANQNAGAAGLNEGAVAISGALLSPSSRR